MRKPAELISAIVAAVGVAGTVPTAAQAPPDYGFDWATIGDPGNRPANQQEAPRYYPPLSNPPILAGDVDHRYRLTRTEVTVGQWMEYVEAYWPYRDGSLNDPAFTSDWIVARNPDPGPGETPQFELRRPDAGAFPANMSWYHAARYVNWLHNGKTENKSAFTSGAYDTSTFGGTDEHGNPTDQPRRSPGAKFWIPSLDEWTKGMYWDPDKNGPGEGGYWRMPDGGDEPLVSAPPDAGGETNAGEHFFNLPFEERLKYFRTGLYPDTQSPWGLLDGSGGVKEWSEDLSPTPEIDSRVWQGSSLSNPFHEYEDRLDTLGISNPRASSKGLRIASLVPTPGSALALSLGMGTGLARGRRRCAPTPSGGCGGTVSRHRDAAGASGAATS